MTTSMLEKKNVLSGLSLGDRVKLTNGLEYEFVRLKKTKFLGKRNGQQFDIPVEMFVEIVSQSEIQRFDSNKLANGELFYILNQKQQAVLLRFKYMINEGKVMAENPVSNTGVRVDVGLIKGSLNDLVRAGN